VNKRTLTIVTVKTSKPINQWSIWINNPNKYIDLPNQWSNIPNQPITQLTQSINGHNQSMAKCINSLIQYINISKINQSQNTNMSISQSNQYHSIDQAIA